MGQIPFIKVLIPVICGILLCQIISPLFNLALLSCIGLVIIFISFFTHKHKKYQTRYFFGLGYILFLFSITVQYCQYHIDKSIYTPPQTATSYIGNVIDLPQQKQRSIACQVQLTYPIAKKVVFYFEPDSNSHLLMPGDELLIHALIQPFKNLGNPDEFDYRRFMQRKGFSGSAYVGSTGWMKTGRYNSSLKVKALRLRVKMLDRYRAFDLDHDAYSFISALIMGHKYELSDELRNTFRTSGTSHILAVSGLHVGIIYAVIIFFFSFLGNRGWAYVLKQLLVLFCLWGYVLLTGMPVSVVRAAIMLSMMCIGSVINKKGLTYNTLAAAALFILLINPMYLFDVGFQLSFTSVVCILFFQPRLFNLFKPKNKLVAAIWTLFTLSLAAQVGVFPLVLYYFGTFPTYFFITNLLVLPFIAIIIYSTLLLTLLSLFSFLNLGFIQAIYKAISLVIQHLIHGVLYVVRFFESLPLSELRVYNLSLKQLCLLFVIILFLSLYLMHRKSSRLIALLVSVSLLLFTYTYSYINPKANQFVVYNSYHQPEIGYIINGKKSSLSVVCNQVIAHPSARIVLLSENKLNYHASNNPIPIDLLIVASDNSFSVTQLLTIFHPKQLVIDSSISSYSAKLLIKECELHHLSYHDISNSGALVVKF